MIRAPAVFAFVALAGGVLLADLVRVPAPWWGASLVVALPGLAWTWRSRRGLAVMALLVVGLSGALAAAWRQPPPLTVAACGPGSVWRLRVDSAVTRTPAADALPAQAFDADLVAEECSGAWQPRHGRARLTSWSGPPVVRGDLLQARLSLFPLAVSRNPTDRDAETMARRRALSARAKLVSHHVIVAHATGPLAGLGRWRQAAAVAFETELEPAAAGVAKAVALGDRGGIEPAQREVWARAGVAHLLAVSGLHVGFLAGLVFGLWRLLFGLVPGLVERFSARRAAAVLSVPALVGYCLATGASPSAVRATVMAVAFLLGLAFGRPSTGTNALGLAGLFLLALDPTSLYDPSFLLSFAAVAALLLAPRLPSVRGWRRFGRYLAVSALASVAATLATAPITATLFGSVSLVAPLCNLVAVPLGAAVATPLAILYALSAPWAPQLAEPLAWLLARALELLDALATLAGGAELAAVQVPEPTGVEIAAYYVLVVGGVLLMRRRRTAIPLTVAAVALLVSLVVRFDEARGDGQLTLLHPYVGQGEATVAVLPRRTVMVFDAGGSARGTWDPGREVVAPLLRRRGITRIDIGVLSHPHPDHLGGWRYLIERVPVGELWWSGVGADEPIQRQVLDIARRRGTRVRTVAELPAMVERDGVRIEILHPRGAAEELALADVNDVSVVLRLSHGARSFLLTGDIGVDAETELAPRLRPTDGFKAPHHGSRSSSSEGLLEALRPTMAVISVGEANDYGLPHGDILARYAAWGIQVWRTDVDGAVSMRSDGQTWQIESYRGRRGGWNTAEVQAAP